MNDNPQYPFIYCMGLAGYELCPSDDGETIAYRYVSPSGGKPYEHHAKVRYTVNGRAYFLANGRRIHLDECIRKNV